VADVGGFFSTATLIPSPGLYAVSATALDGIMYAPGWENYRSDFHDRQPIGRAGYSILIYHVNPHLGDPRILPPRHLRKNDVL
jgi:hypothetical protein